MIYRKNKSLLLTEKVAFLSFEILITSFGDSSLEK